ncbi:MAG: CYTH domain-containing protein [Candidatus Moranbacteria bacterium]|nr:CYTH domain-containing protein [Candidatus Moranbacteria bacterium]
MKNFKKTIYNFDEGLEYLSSRIKGKTLEIPDRPVMVGICGGSASGKTTLAQRIKDIFNGDAMIFSMDDYFKGKDFMQSKEAKEKGIVYFDHPEALDIDLFNQHFEALKQGKSVKRPIYDMNYKVQKRVGYKKVKPRKIIIVEGIFALSDYFSLDYDVKVFVHTDKHGRVIRRLYRNLKRTGQKPLDILKIFFEYVDPMHDKFVEASKKNAEMIIKNQYSAKTETKKFRYHKIQLKFNKDLKEKEIKKAGAILTKTSIQIDDYYMPPNQNLSKTNEKMKIRSENNSYKFMYEGPRLFSDFKVSPVFEFELDENTKDKFQKAYGKKIKSIKKKRNLYAIEDIFFAKDTVYLALGGKAQRKIGDFIEIYFNEHQKDDKIKLENILNKLGLDLKDHIMASYFDLSE